jgi:hypothetical protein
MPENQRIDTTYWDLDETVQWDPDNSSVEFLDTEEE